MRNFALLALLAVVLLMTGCDGGGQSPYSAMSDAQATQGAAAAHLRETEARIAERSMQATLSAAHTQSASEAQIALLQAQMQATRDAYDLAIARDRATAEAAEYYARETQMTGQTATAYHITETPLAATQAAIVREAERQAQAAEWDRRMVPVLRVLPLVILAIVVILLIIGAVQVFRRMMPVIEMRARTIKRGENDAPIIIFDGLIVDPDRSFGPALLYGPRGATSTGYAPNPQFQERHNARDQMVDLIRALPADKAERKAAQHLAANIMSQMPAVYPAKIEIIEQADSSPVAGWIEEVERKLLTDGEGGDA